MLWWWVGWRGLNVNVRRMVEVRVMPVLMIMVTIIIIIIIIVVIVVVIVFIVFLDITLVAFVVGWVALLLLWII
jgi:hypothetical protein